MMWIENNETDPHQRKHRISTSPVTEPERGAQKRVTTIRLRTISTRERANADSQRRSAIVKDSYHF